MFYLDTSFVISLFVPDAHSGRALQWLEARSAAELVLSAWARVEFAGVLARQVRMGRMTARNADSTIEDFRRWSSTHCQIIVPGSADFDAAVALVRRYTSGLRGPDALHLATVTTWGNPALVTFDEAMASAAAGLGVKCEEP